MSAQSDHRPDFVFKPGMTMFGCPLPCMVKRKTVDEKTGKSMEVERFVEPDDGHWTQERCAKLMLWKDDCRQRLMLLMQPKDSTGTRHLSPEIREQNLALRKQVKTAMYMDLDIAEERAANGARFLKDNPRDWSLLDIVYACMRHPRLMKPLVEAGHLPDPVDYDIVPGTNQRRVQRIDQERFDNAEEIAQMITACVGPKKEVARRDWGNE